MRRSRAGFVVCPGCLSHARLPVAGGSTHCGFCGTPLRSDGLAADNAALGRTASNSRTGVLLASLLGVSLAACGSEDETLPDADAVTDVAGDGTEEDIADESSPDALYGQPPDVADDVIGAPEYGLPADVEEDIQEDVPPVDAYGLPADVVEDIADDVIPGPEYGLPADPDAATDGSTDTTPPDMPAYGLPPEPDPK
jgi:hypothetical protein